MKIKKHISLFLAFFLLVSNMGFSLDVHYCGGEIASLKPVFWRTVEFQNTRDKNCCPPKATTALEKKDSCCKNKEVHFEKKSDTTTVNFIVFHPNFVFLFQEFTPVFFTEISNFEKTQTISYYCDANAPPLFQLYHQYIFYA